MGTLYLMKHQCNMSLDNSSVMLHTIQLHNDIMLQCLRRLFEERDYMHALNGLKYFSTIVAVVMRTGNDLKWGITWRIMAAASSGVATIVSTYWDIVIDWGLLQRNSKNPWLREKLLISNRSVYFVAIVSTSRNTANGKYILFDPMTTPVLCLFIYLSGLLLSVSVFLITVSAEYLVFG